MSAVKEFESLMIERGTESYGENVSIAEHCLLTALAAETSGASDNLIAAALMHDVGHWLDQPDDEYGIHTHDELGGKWVADRFGPEVSEPVRLHVQAKRYLCAIEPAYYDILSHASQYTLEKQGGPMSSEEVAAFKANRFAEDAITLRKLEDGLGKLSDVKIPIFEQFVERLTRMAKPR